MPLLAEDVPERDRKRGVEIAGQPDLLGAGDEMGLGLALHADPGQIALDVGGKHGNAGRREAFGQNLQRDRLARAGRAGDETVAIGELQLDVLDAGVAAPDQNAAVLGKEPGVGRRVLGRLGLRRIGHYPLHERAFGICRAPHGRSSHGTRLDETKALPVGTLSPPLQTSVA